MADTAAAIEPSVSAQAEEARYYEVLAALFTELDGITAWLRQVDPQYDRRIQLFVMLNDLGVSNPKVAAHIDGGSEAVRAALSKYRQQQATQS
jgi:hypothetical protein